MRRGPLAIAAVTAAATLVLAGCSPSGSTVSQQASNEISLWYLSDAEPIVTQAIDRFEKANPDITVKATGYSNDEYKTKVAVGLGTASGPDVFHTWGGGEFKTYVDAGQVVDLTDFTDENGLGDKIGAGALGAGQVDATQYAIPVIFDASMFWYNTEIFDSLGLEVPTTWDELIDVITKIKSAGLVPIAMANKTQWPGGHWWSEFVTLACGPDEIPNISADAAGASFNDPCIVDAHEHLQELVDAGAFNDGFNGLDYDSGESRQLFWSGAAAMNHMGNWTISAASTEAPEMLSKMDFFTMPAWEGAKGTTDMMTGGIGMAFAVAKNNRNRDASLELLKYLTDQETGQAAADAGRVPVISGTTISDPLTAKVSDAIGKASALSLWPDQFLAPEVSQTMLNQVQALFGKEATPQEAADAMEVTLEKVRK